MGTYQYSMTTPNGEIRYLHWVIRALFDNEKQLIEFQGVGGAVTEENLIKKELEKAKNTLEEQVEAGHFLGKRKKLQNH